MGAQKQSLAHSRISPPPVVGIIASLYNQPYADQLLEGALACFKTLGVTKPPPRVFTVPGCVEIPIVAQKLAQTHHCDVLVALGIVLQGQTSHHEQVAFQVSLGCQLVSLASGIPLIFGVLTVSHLTHLKARLRGRHHKGREAACAALHVVQTLRQVEKMRLDAR